MITSHTTLFLRDFDHYNRYAKLPNFQSEMQSIDFVEGQLPSNCRCQGSFWTHDGSFFALARIEGSLFARIGDDVFELSKNVSIHVRGKAPNRIIEVLRDGILCLSVPYEVSADEVFTPDETPFAEDEDFDFGLLLANISQSEERKKIMLEQP